MKEYKKAIDLKIGDLFFKSVRGDLDISIRVFSIELKEVGGKRYLFFNRSIMFKENGTKGAYCYRDSDVNKEIEKLEEDSFSVDSLLYFTDKRVATTHSVNYYKKELEKSQEVIKKELDYINVVSLKIAQLRQEEFNQ